MSLMFFGNRLIIARERAMHSQNELAKLLKMDLSLLQKYELNLENPSIEIISLICKIFKYPRYYFSVDINRQNDNWVSFRNSLILSEKDKKSILALTSFATLLLDSIDENYSVEKLIISNFSNCNVEILANNLRCELGLGLEPISNILQLLESLGIRIFNQNSNIETFSLWHNCQPCIFMKYSQPLENKRFDLAHELGHFILHKECLPVGQTTNQEADQFAKSLLLPKDAMLNYSEIKNFNDLISINSIWNVPLQILMARLLELKLIDNNFYKEAQKELILKQNLQSRAFKNKKFETSLFWNSVFKKAFKINCGYREICNTLAIPLNDFEILFRGLIPVALSTQKTHQNITDRDKPNLHLVQY